MADVKNLFLGGLALRNMLVVLAAAIIVLLCLWKEDGRRDIREILTKAYRFAAALFGAAVAFLIIAFTIDFTTCFTVFHEIFFTNDLWIFDPQTDYMIRMLPEGFFFSMARKILIYFIISQGALTAILLLWEKLAGAARTAKKE